MGVQSPGHGAGRKARQGWSSRDWLSLEGSGQGEEGEDRGKNKRAGSGAQEANPKLRKANVQSLYTDRIQNPIVMIKDDDL